MRIGLLGASKIGIHAIIKPARRRDDVTVAAVAARDPQRARRYARKYSIAHVAASYQDLIQRDDLDLIYVGLPQSAHCEWTLKSLAAGKPVLCEKPFALNASQAEQMVDCARKNGLLLMEAFHYRFHAVMRRMVDVVRSGQLGQLTKAYALFEAGSPYDPDELRWNPKLGGGALMDTGCYTVHALRTLIGREPRVVTADCEWRHGVDVNTHADLDFADGLVARISCSLDTPRPIYAKINLTGDQGSLTVEGFPLPQFGCTWRLETDHGVDTAVPEGVPTYEAQLAYVADVCLQAEQPLTGGDDAINNMRVIDSIYAKAGR